MKQSAIELERKAYQYRKRFLELFSRIGFGHVTSAFSWAEIATVLYNEIMSITVDPYGIVHGDRMVVSKGHGAGILYPIFEDLGFVSPQEMDDIIQIGGNSRKLRSLYYPGFDFYGGSLGIGLGLAAGLAKADQLSENGVHTFCIVGDAEMYEGSIWEAALFAGHNRLDHLIVVVDRNELGCSDFTEHMLALEPLARKWESFNWDVMEIDGHDVRAVYSGLEECLLTTDRKPKCVIAKTKKGQGLEALTGLPLMHGYMPKGLEVKRALQELEKKMERLTLENRESGGVRTDRECPTGQKPFGPDKNKLVCFYILSSQLVVISVSHNVSDNGNRKHRPLWTGKNPDHGFCIKNGGQNG